MNIRLLAAPLLLITAAAFAATKSKVEFGCMGHDGYFDDLKIWNADPVQP